MEPTTIATLLKEFGVTATLAIVTSLTIIGSVKYLGRRLFDDQTGLLTKVVTRHVQFVDATEKQGDAMIAIAHATQKAACDHATNQTALHRAFEHNADALLDIAAGVSAETKIAVGRHVDQIKRILNQ